MELWDIYDRQRRTTGRFHVRGTPMGRGEYHLTAFVWVFNRQRELLLTRRAPEKEHYANCWAATAARPSSARRACRPCGASCARKRALRLMRRISIWCGAFASTPPSVMSISSSMISRFPRCICSPARQRRPAGVQGRSGGSGCLRRGRSAGCPPPAPAAGRIPKDLECLRPMGLRHFLSVQCWEEQAAKWIVGERHAAPARLPIES